jgi:hypothetical protein
MSGAAYGVLGHFLGRVWCGEWGVGGEKSIHKWGDKWLPTKVIHEVQSPIHIVDGEAKACALIDENTRWWNIPILEAIFNAEEVSIICGLPICSNPLWPNPKKSNLGLSIGSGRTTSKGPRG